MPVSATRVQPDPTTPPTETSDEAKSQQLEMARKQGADYREAVAHMAEDVALVGAEAAAGEMIVAIAIEKAEGMYEPSNGQLKWSKPTDQNFHVEVSARDAADHRFIPGLDIDIRVMDGSGDRVCGATLPMLWHPWLYHYGANLHLPEEEDLTVEVEIAAPKFGRHDEKNGRRYTKDVFVRFDGIRLPREG